MKATSHGAWWMSIASIGTAGPASQTAGSGLLVELEVDDALHALRLQVAGAVEGLLAVELRVAEDELGARPSWPRALIESDTIFTNGSESPSEM